MEIVRNYEEEMRAAALHSLSSLLKRLIDKNVITEEAAHKLLLEMD